MNDPARPLLAIIDGQSPGLNGGDPIAFGPTPGDARGGMTDALTVRAADLERAQPPRWAWRHRIVLGYLNLLLGNEGIGKGTLIAWLIAKLTRGELPGDLRGQPCGVGVLSDEDSFDDVWTPRLHAAGADLALVVQIERPDGGFVNVREDRERLAHVVRANGLRVLFVDQLLDNLGAGTHDWRQKAVRDALQPLRSLARELDIATLGCLHPNKRADSFRQLIAGAPAFNSVSRSSLLLAQHPEDENLRVLVRGKGNLSQTPQAVEFQIAEHRFYANAYEFKVPLAQGFHVGDLTVDDLVGNETTTKEHSKVADAAEIVEALLPRDGEWHPAKPIYEACAGEQIDERTVKRAKHRLGVEHRRAQTFPASIDWRWPTQDAHGARVETFPSVPTVPSANGRLPLRGSSEDTQDTRDTENKRPHCVPSDPDTELDRLQAKFPDLEGDAAPSLAAAQVGTTKHEEVGCERPPVSEPRASTTGRASARRQPRPRGPCSRGVHTPASLQGFSRPRGSHNPKARRRPKVSGSPYLMVEHVAALLGCSKRTVHERARLAEIPHRRPPASRRLLFLEAEIRAWLDGAPLELVELPRGGRVVRPRTRAAP